MASRHWGEISEKTRSDIFTPDVTADIERSMDKYCLAEYQDEGDVKKTENIIFSSMDPLIMYAISLHKYANDMTEMIRVAELATDVNVIPSEDAAPPMPVMPEINIKHRRNNLNYIPQEPTIVVHNWESVTPELNVVLIRNILAKCVAVMFAHIGFETTHQSVLDVLTDVLENFFEKFCHRVVDAVEEEEKGNKIGFPHVIERVLTESGMGGVKGLHDYYQSRVVNYVNILQKRCKKLNDHYALLLIPKNSCPTHDSKKLKVEADETLVEMDNSEVHFVAFDGETSVLETGYQLLNSLEAEENLQGLGDISDEKQA